MILSIHKITNQNLQKLKSHFLFKFPSFFLSRVFIFSLTKQEQSSPKARTTNRQNQKTKSSKIKHFSYRTQIEQRERETEREREREVTDGLRRLQNGNHPYRLFEKQVISMHFRLVRSDSIRFRVMRIDIARDLRSLLLCREMDWRRFVCAQRDLSVFLD